MATKISSIPIRSDLLQFFQENESARKNFINKLIHVFPKYNGNIASFRKEMGSTRLVIWIINHPECIPELKKCLETNDGTTIVEKIAAISLEHGTSVTNITSLRIKKEIRFLEAWSTIFRLFHIDLAGYLLSQQDITKRELRLRFIFQKYDIDALVKKNKQLMDENVTLKDKGLQNVGGKKTICKTRQHNDIRAIIADLKKSLARLEKYANEGSIVS